MARLVVAPDVTVRWQGEELELSSESSTRCHRSTDPELVEVVHLFAAPRSVAEALEELPGVEEGDLSALVRELVASGVLVHERLLPGRGERPEPSLVSHDEAAQLVRERRLKLTGLRYDDLGLTVSTCGKDELSRGCQACKDGGWVCYYLGWRCTATCSFCPQPIGRRRWAEEAESSRDVSGFKELIAGSAHLVSGLSLSGGELFLYLDRAEELTGFAREALPHAYRWAYTNGLVATVDGMKRLADAGLQELRVNLAASDYADAVVERVREAVDHVPWVTVEVPATEATLAFLLDREGLLALDEMGVKQLNLAQLSIPPGPSTPARESLTDRETFHSVDGLGEALYSLDAWLRTYDVIELAERKRLTIRINDCSSEAKLAQHLARRSRWGASLRGMKLLTYPIPAAPSDVAGPPEDALRSTSGLAWVVIEHGDGAVRPGSDDFVVVRYTGWTTDGRPFDSTLLHDEPSMAVSLRSVVPGWSECLRTMVEGERRRVWIPAQLAYAGEPGRPKGTLVFELELVEIID